METLNLHRLRGVNAEEGETVFNGGADTVHQGAAEQALRIGSVQDGTVFVEAVKVAGEF